MDSILSDAANTLKDRLEKWERARLELQLAAAVHADKKKELGEAVHQVYLAGVPGKNAAERDAFVYDATFGIQTDVHETHKKWEEEKALHDIAYQRLAVTKILFNALLTGEDHGER